MRLEASLKLSNDRFFTRYQTLTYQRLTGRNGREAASGEIRVKGSLASESRLFRDERPKVGFGRSGQSNKLAPVPELAQVGEPMNQLLRADWPCSSTLSVFAPLQYLNRYSKRPLRTCRRMQTASSDPLSKPSNRAYLTPVTM